MAKLTIIAAIGKNRELGKNNRLIWHLKEDLKFFKENTTGHKIVMGYNTFASLPHLLPNREHYVLTHKELQEEEIHVFHDIESLKEKLQELEEEIYIIGGSSIYQLFIPYVEELLLTEIDAECKDADAYFPEFKKEDYEREVIKEENENNIHYQFVRYRRVK